MSNLIIDINLLEIFHYLKQNLTIANNIGKNNMNSESQNIYTLKLIERHGELMGARVLSEAIGYPSLAAMNMAIKRGKLNIKTFEIEGRKGRYALTVDVANWLWNLKSGYEDKKE